MSIWDLLALWTAVSVPVSLVTGHVLARRAAEHLATARA